MSETIYKFLIAIICFIIFGILCVSALTLYISFDLPDVKKLALYTPAVHSQILSRDGKPLLTIGKEKREMAGLKEIPQKIIDAFLAAEDSNFYEHHGVDYFGILRALWADIRAGKLVQGGSTITQQVAKSLLLSNQKIFSRKLKDILLAQKIEQVFTKEEILNLYLNHVYFGAGYYGIKAAVKGHFDKELKEVTLAEVSLLAGLLVAPGRYSPYISTAHAKSRQKYVLGRLLETGKITNAEFEKASQEEVRLRLQKSDESVSAGYFTEWIRQRVVEQVGEEELLTNGIRVVTTLDWDLQQAAEKAVKNGVSALDKRQGFNGPIKSLSSEEEIQSFTLESRKNFFAKNSKYFKITTSGEKKLEMDFNDEEYLQAAKEERLARNNHNTKFFWPGMDSNRGDSEHNRILRYLKTGESYEAIVEHVIDQQKMIYVSIAGAKGLIAQQKFQWARKRKISEFSANAGNIVNYPSEIVKPGDVIKVKILDTPKSPYDFFDEKYKKILKAEKSDKKGGNIIDEIKKQLFFPCELDQDPKVEGALLAIQAQTGEILAMVGGIDFDKSKFNRVIQAARQPGSAYKPIIYASALENGYTPATIIIDSPEALAGADDASVWKPKNYDGEFEGAITFRRSLERSRNVPTIKMALDVGIKKIIDFSSRIGMDVSKIDRDLSLSLGSFGVSLLNLVTTYTIFPNQGRLVTPNSIVSIIDRNGKNYHLSDENNSQKNAQVYDPRLAYIMSNLLRGVIQSGTATAARELGPYVAGKTGTTNDYVDAWFVGFSANVVTGVWTGFDNNETLGYGETGAKAALPIWQEFMKKALYKYGENEFKAPPGIIHVAIDKDTGKPAGENNPNTFMEAFVQGTEPGRSTFSSTPQFVGDSNAASSSASDPQKTTEGGDGSGAKDGKGEILDDDYYSNH
ncbi:MAG: PBP1A family penicillin-binding protein [Oligoflexia bacterium]|nr:PBP1A family penicillin-binding protein [Oligoflexia bacterium]MBF0366633.1 PBP1A family penicillin-binding protein [Oligoflexia bacterium]